MGLGSFGFLSHLPLVVVSLLDSDLVLECDPARLGIHVWGTSPAHVEECGVLLLLHLHRHILRGVWLHC